MSIGGAVPQSKDKQISHTGSEITEITFSL